MDADKYHRLLAKVLNETCYPFYVVHPDLNYRCSCNNSVTKQADPKCKKCLGAKTLLITNKNVAAISTNISDRDVDKYEYDYHITNDGTLKELQQKAKEFVEKLK